MGRPVWVITAILSLLAGSTVFGATLVQTGERLKIGLALSGGGARGAAHIGVLKELERLRIPVDFIAGTSVGAVVGGLYASGMGVDEIVTAITLSDLDKIFKDQQNRKDISTRRKFDQRLFQLDKEFGVKDGKDGSGKIHLPGGVKHGQKLSIFLDKLLLPVASTDDFDILPIPFRAVATDIVSSESVVLGKGSLAQAIRASMSIPTLFSPVELGGHTLVDGGISDNLPVDVVREMGADIVIAVDIGSQLFKKQKLSNAVEISLQLMNILVRRTTEEQIRTLGDRDILIQPELGNFPATDFKDAAKLIPLGVDATLGHTLKLASLALSPGDYKLHASNRLRDRGTQRPLIAYIEVKNDTSLADEFILSKLEQRVNEPLNIDQLEQDISTLYGLEIFKTVDYSVVEKQGQVGLIIEAVQKPWGPNYLDFGFSYSSDFSHDNNLSFLLGYTVTPTNERNGEWRTLIKLGREHGVFTEYHQPLAVGSPYYANGALTLNSRLYNEFEAGEKVRITRVDEARITIALGREYNNWGDVRFGLNRFISDANTETGSDSETVVDTDGGEIFARFRSDTLDDAFFPTSGLVSQARWVNSRAELGADNEFQKGLVDVYGVSTLGEKHTLFLGARYGATYQGVAPVQNGFRLGGLFNLPGFVNDELSGQNVYLLRSAYQRKLSDTLPFSHYAGASLQYGNLSTELDQLNLSDGITSVSTWLAWKTFIGPVFLGYGYADTGDNSFYLEIGSQF